MIKKIKAIYWGIQKHPVYLNMVTSVIIIVVSGLIVYHLTSQTQHNLIIECRNLGEKIGKKVNSQSYESIALNPEYYYNPKLKKCFYCGGFIEDGFMTKFIIDAYTNKEIISFIKNTKNPSEGDTDTAYRFIRLKSLLFGEIKDPKKYEINLMREAIQ